MDHTLVMGGADTGEGALSGMQRYYQGTSTAEWPNSVEYRTVRDVFNDPYNGDAIVVMSKISGGMGAIEGTEVIVSGVPGCSGLNGHKLIKHIYHGNGYPVMFSVQNLDGSAFTCPDAYDVGAHQFRVMPGDSSWFSGVTFTNGSADVTVTGLTSSYLVYAGDRIRFSTTGSLPAGVTAGTDYYLTYRSGTTVRLAAARDGTAVTFSGTGSGTHSAQVVDERTSYAGAVMIAPYAQEFRHMTILSKHRFAVDLCGACDGRAGTSIGWGFHDTVVSSPSMGTVKEAYFLAAKPRAFFTNGAADVALEYFDASALAVGRAVYFEGTCTLPAPLQPRTAYYVVASNPGAGTIQVSATAGGAAISNYVNNTSCAYARQFLTAAGFTSSVVSVSADVFSPGDTVVTGGYGTPPYPVATGASYYVDSASSVTVGGVSFRHLTLKQSAGDTSPLQFAAPPERMDNWLRSVTTGGPALRNFEVSAYTTLDQSDRNLYYSSDPAKAYCGVNQTHGGTDSQGTCAADQAALNNQEPASAIVDPAVNYDTAGRATASSPAALWNKGYLAGTDSVEAGPVAAVVRWRAPAAGDACSVDLYADAGWSTLLESHASVAGRRWRAMMLGTVTALQPARDYWYRVQCGYEVMTGTFQTAAAQSGTARLGVGLPALAGASQAVLETSADGANWVAGAAASCASGCELQSTDVARGAALWYRWRRLDAGGATIQRGGAAAVVAR